MVRGFSAGWPACFGRMGSHGRTCYYCQISKEFAPITLRLGELCIQTTCQEVCEEGSVETRYEVAGWSHGVFFIRAPVASTLTFWLYAVTLSFRCQRHIMINNAFAGKYCVFW